MRGRRDSQLRFAVSWYLGGLAAALVIANVSARWWGVTPRGRPPRGFGGDSLFGPLLRWDGNWYRSIAEGGYALTPNGQSNVAYFPAYPMAMRAFGWLAGNAVVGGIVVTVVAALIGLWGLATWCAERGMPDAATRFTLVALLVFPYGFYLYGVVYSDALFLAAVVWAFVWLERDQVWLAGVIGAIASAARPTSVAVLVGLTAVLLERRGAGRHSKPGLQRRDAAVAIAGLGLAAYATFLWVRFGDGLAFWRIQREWGQATGIETLLKRPLWWEIRHLVHRSLVATTLIQGAILLVAMGSVPAIWRRFGWGYAVYVASFCGLIFVASSTFIGAGRYLMAAFPLVALAGERLARMRATWRVAVLLASATCAAVMVASFAHGVYLA